MWYFKIKDGIISLAIRNSFLDTSLIKIQDPNLVIEVQYISVSVRDSFQTTFSDFSIGLFQNTKTKTIVLFTVFRMEEVRLEFDLTEQY